ncbi:MAG TPA: hypothetical protein VFE47_18615 [Tepidisphaeraceae bacterium]|jgi:hypothetical protein|nr:hypothetical protein [Tepidisphaeraceae bacterium]
MKHTEILTSSRVKRSAGPDLLLGIALLLSLLSPGCTNIFPAPVKVDLTTPKSAALAYLKAIQAGDVRTARAACFGTPEQLQWVDARATLVAGMRQFDNALYAKFGNVTSQVHTDMHDSLLKLADVWVTSITDGTVDADDKTARITPARNGFFTHFANTIVLQHTKDGWKVDVANTYAEKGTPQDFAQITADCSQWKAWGDVFLDVTRYIRAGTYHTAAQAADALATRLGALQKKTGQ